jgi:hypothetical protein
MHRLTINAFKGFQNCPALILKRDSKWINFVRFFKAEGEKLYGDGNVLYHQIMHPDFEGFKVVREDRSAPIIEFLSRASTPLRGLDMGAFIGFYSHRLSLAGHTMSAIEHEQKYASAFETLDRLYGTNCQIMIGNLYDVQIPVGAFDFALMLSVLYHLVRNDESRSQAFVDELKTKIPLFFVDTEERTGLLSEGKLRRMFEGYLFEKIFSGNDGRAIFAISRN